MPRGERAAQGWDEVSENGTRFVWYFEYLGCAGLQREDREFGKRLSRLENIVVCYLIVSHAT
jgi:hypothetical protein